MRSLSRLFVIVLLLCAAGSASAADDARDITPGEDLAGWVVEGTRFRDEAKTEPVWTAKDGVVRCAGKGFGFLRYDKEMCDFELSAEYRMAARCNSGLGIRTVKFTGPASTRPSYASYEIQILDDTGKPTDEHASMSLYRYVAPTKNAVKPAGEWNKLEITCRGPHILIKLNGETVQDVDQSKIEAIKNKPLCGYISLQNHGKTIEWRNLRLKELAKAAGDEQTTQLKLQLRSRELTGSDPEVWKENLTPKNFAAAETAIIICDMWDDHWCKMASKRCDALAKKMAPLIDDAREHGVHVIHCPSDTMEFYKDHPARKRMLAVPHSEPPMPIERWCYLDTSHEAPLPIDDKEGGCDDAETVKNLKAWSRQHPAIAVHDDDVISESGKEVYSYLRQHGIKNILYVGVHTNMCVLGRSFGIRQMTKLGFNTVLVRDLTDAMYDPRKRPFVSHEEGTELVVQHVEKYWCPTTLSDDLKTFHLASRDAE